jgi:iron complex outermembrane receptor protein
VDLADIVVLATRTPEASLDVPASISRVDGAALRAGLGVNLSESLGPVPGISVQNRGNYAQDLQLSIRGFGARSSFGARGIRLYADGIPATMPDGQGQYSHFDLTGADRIEILRGPFSALYGNSAGGVIAITTADAPVGGMTEATVEGGSLGTQRYLLRDGGTNGTLNYTLDAAHFATDGYRDHSHAERNTANAKLHVDLSPATRLTLVANAIGTPPVDDPLGLTAAQVASNPRQAGTNALAYNTRKSLAQEQVGATPTKSL